MCPQFVHFYCLFSALRHLGARAAPSKTGCLNSELWVQLKGSFYFPLPQWLQRHTEKGPRHALPLPLHTSCSAPPPPGIAKLLHIIFHHRSFNWRCQGLHLAHLGRCGVGTPLMFSSYSRNPIREARGEGRCCIIKERESATGAPLQAAGPRATHRCSGTTAPLTIYEQDQKQTYSKRRSGACS